MPKDTAAEHANDRSEDLTVFESRLINLLALLLVQERNQVTQISLLARAGFRPAEIASLLGTTRNTVSVRLSKQRSAKKPRRAKKPSKR